MTTTEVRPEAATAKKAGAKGKDAPKSKKKKMIIIAVLVLALVGGAYKFFLAPKPKPGPPVGGEIVQLDPETVNLSGGHYLKIALAIQVVQGKSTAATFQGSHAQQLIIDEFSNRTVPSLSTNAMRKKLLTELDKQVKLAYKDEVFTTFVTQYVMQ